MRILVDWGSVPCKSPTPNLIEIGFRPTGRVNGSSGKITDQSLLTVDALLSRVGGTGWDASFCKAGPPSQ